MSGDGEATEAFRRAGARAVYHLLRAGVESLKALEAVIDELGGIGKERPEPDEQGKRTRIDLE